MGLSTFIIMMAISVIWGYFEDLRNGKIGWFIGRILFTIVFFLLAYAFFSKI